MSVNNFLAVLMIYTVGVVAVYLAKLGWYGWFLTLILSICMIWFHNKIFQERENGIDKE